MHPSSASADLPGIAYLAVLLRQNCFFIAIFSAELGGTTAHLRRLPRKGRAGGAYRSLLKHRVQGAALPAMHPSSPSADLFSDASLRLCFGRAVFLLQNNLKYPPLRSGYKSRNYYFYLWPRNACGRFRATFSRLGRNGKQPFLLQCNRFRRKRALQLPLSATTFPVKKGYRKVRRLSCTPKF